MKDSLLASRYEGFYSTLKNTTSQEDAVLAFEAFDTDIGAESDYLPLVAATGVLFLQANHIAQLYLHKHTRTTLLLINRC